MNSQLNINEEEVENDEEMAMDEEIGDMDI